jgi:hypothetical protein
MTKVIDFKTTSSSTIAALIVGIIAATTLLSTGCGPPLSASRTIELAPNDIRTILIDSIGRDQTVTVTATSETEFSIHCHLEGDENAVDAAIALDNPSDKILAQQTNTKEAKVEFEIPSGSVGAVRFQSWSSDSAEVTYSISN